MENTAQTLSVRIFQFHKGTIRTMMQDMAAKHPEYFNSIKVRLELIVLFHFLNVMCYFNSIKVRLERDTGLKRQNRLTHFNSIKVRLERFRLHLVWIYISYFNSIKVRLELAILRIDTNKAQFQFHKGTIRTLQLLPFCLLLLHFNSIKVRLEPSSRESNLS